MGELQGTFRFTGPLDTMENRRYRWLRLSDSTEWCSTPELPWRWPASLRTLRGFASECLVNVRFIFLSYWHRSSSLKLQMTSAQNLVSSTTRLKWKSPNRVRLWDLMKPTRLLCPWNAPGKNSGMGSRSLLQGTFLTQRSNLGLPHCRRILYHLTTGEALPALMTH